MQIVTTREFRANQKKYFDMGETEVPPGTIQHKTL